LTENGTLLKVPFFVFGGGGGEKSGVLLTANGGEFDANEGRVF
jgi:hypothetical protein